MTSKIEPVGWLPTATVNWLREYSGLARGRWTVAHNCPIKSDGGVAVYGPEVAERLEAAEARAERAEAQLREERSAYILAHGVFSTESIRAKSLLDEAKEALKALLQRDQINTCQHENTHRGGFLWEICDDCGRKWADDRGGKPEWKDPDEWVAARSTLAKLENTDDRD